MGHANDRFFAAAPSNSLIVSWESEAPKKNVLLLPATPARLVNRLWDRDRLVEMQLAAPCLGQPN